jgi:hypothetical protein
MKTITIPISVPDDFKWMALQPYGTWTAFKRKPVIVEEIEGDSTCYYWGVQNNELELSNNGPELENWKGSLKEI